MNNKVTTIGVTEWMGHNWFAMFMINPPLWLMAQLGVQRFPRLWYSRSVMSQLRFELGLCLHSFDSAWFASYVKTLGSLEFTQHSLSSASDAVTCQFPWSQYSPAKLCDNYCSNGQGAMMEHGLCMASYPGFLWLLHSWVCLVSMENKQKSASVNYNHQMVAWEIKAMVGLLLACDWWH